MFRYLCLVAMLLTGCQAPRQYAPERTAYSSPIVDRLVDVAVDAAVSSAARAVERHYRR